GGGPPREGPGGPKPSPGGYGGAGSPPVSRGGLGGIVPPASRADRAPGHPLAGGPGRASGLRCGRTQRRPRSGAGYISSAVAALSGSRDVGDASSAIEEPTLTRSSDG